MWRFYKTQLGWEPKYSFEYLVDEMIRHDMKLAQQEKILKDYTNNELSKDISNLPILL